MRERILKLIRQIEAEQGVTVLFAAESGSRAWGFASKDSDYDVRFIYKRPVRDYMKLVKPYDVLDKNHGLASICDEVMDFSGWDITKALNLFRASNPAMMEWIDSPIWYVDRGFRHPDGNTFADELRALRSQVPLKPLGHHYHALSSGNFNRYIKGKEEVTYKKYLYVLRALFCCKWIEQHKSIPPTDFNEIMDAVNAPESILIELRRIISIKQQLDEADQQPGSPELDAYIEEELGKVDVWLALTDITPMPQSTLNEILYRELDI
jgi:predicted nucleotidyltransferase